jgi:hypothetical protein
MLTAQHGVRGPLKGAAKLGSFNMMRHLGIAAGALALALTASGPASAAKVIYTFTGKVISAENLVGVVLGPGFDAGSDFTAAFEVDDSPPLFQSAISPNRSEVYQIQSWLSPVTVHLRINQNDIYFGNDPQYLQHIGYFLQENESHSMQDVLSLYSKDVTDTLRCSFWFCSGYSAEKIIRTNLLSGNDNWFSSGDFRSGNPKTISSFGPLQEIQAEWLYLTYGPGGQIHSNARLRLNPTSLTITGGIVPEPATWALMIGGFGMAGAMLRRRRALAA